MSEEVVKCPNCGGKGTSGFDRCDPPGEYVCDLCGGDGTVTSAVDVAFNHVWHLYQNLSQSLQNANKEIHELRQRLRSEKAARIDWEKVTGLFRQLREELGPLTRRDHEVER